MLSNDTPTYNFFVTFGEIHCSTYVSATQHRFGQRKVKRTAAFNQKRQVELLVYSLLREAAPTVLE